MVASTQRGQRRKEKKNQFTVDKPEKHYTIRVIISAVTVVSHVDILNQGHVLLKECDKNYVSHL